MHKALLKNYLGIEEMTGSDFQEIARGQVESFGANLHDATVEQVEQTDDGFAVETEAGERWEGDYVILATTNKAHQKALGLEMHDGGRADADRNGRTSLSGCYAIGWATRTDKIQAIISAGDGASAALDILSAEKGEAYHDFDVV
jgi:thioredoxin reductase